MKNVIYKIRNVVNGKFYVGSTTDSRKRFWEHRKQLRTGTHHCVYLQRAWNKYGEDCFKFEIVEQLNDKDELFPTEQRWLDEHFGEDYCYNTAAHADAPMRDASPERRAHLAKKTKEWLERAGHPRKGMKNSPEMIAKMLENRVSPKGEDHYRFGKELDAEIRAKISAAQLGVPKTPGRKVSEEGRAKIKASCKRGEDHHSWGKPPTNLEELKRPILAILPDRSERIFESLSALRDEIGVAIGTTIRACNSGKPIQFGEATGWVLSYADGEKNEAPEIPEEYLAYPRTRKDAKATGAKYYFTGLPCDRGHIAPRKTKGACVECLKEDWKVQNDRRSKKNGV